MNYSTKVSLCVNLFIDDERLPDHVTWIKYPETIKGWVVVRNYADALAFFKINGMPRFISFDNDLGEQKEGIDILHWVINYCIDNKCNLPAIAVHSQNCEARDRMVSLASSFIKHQSSI